MAIGVQRDAERDDESDGRCSEDGELQLLAWLLRQRGEWDPERRDRGKPRLQSRPWAGDENDSCERTKILQRWVECCSSRFARDESTDRTSRGECPQVQDVHHRLPRWAAASPFGTRSGKT